MSTAVRLYGFSGIVVFRAFFSRSGFYGPGRSASECAQVPNRVGPQIAGEVSGNYPRLDSAGLIEEFARLGTL